MVSETSLGLRSSATSGNGQSRLGTAKTVLREPVSSNGVPSMV